MKVSKKHYRTTESPSGWTTAYNVHLPDGMTLAGLPAFAAAHGVPDTARLLTDRVVLSPNLSHTVVRLSWFVEGKK